MPVYRERAAAVGDRRAGRLRERLGIELRLTRLDLGLSQTRLARRADVPQSVVSGVEAGEGRYSLEVICRLAAALGHEVGNMRIFPVRSVSLRDSGQLSLARIVIRDADSRWDRRLEEPVGQPPDLRAADLVLLSEQEAIQVEIIRMLIDFQAQLRRERLKQEALAQRLGIPVRLVLAFPDRASVRRVVAAYSDVVSVALPLGSREVWRAIRTGEPLGGDGILWIRTRANRAADPQE